MPVSLCSSVFVVNGRLISLNSSTEFWSFAIGLNGGRFRPYHKLSPSQFPGKITCAYSSVSHWPHANEESTQNTKLFRKAYLINCAQQKFSVLHWKKN